MKKYNILFIFIFCCNTTMIAQEYCDWNEKKINFGTFPTNTIPLTSGWIKSEQFSDEFNDFDTTKWKPYDSTTHEMSPNAFFSSSNVKVGTGKLELLLREENPPLELPIKIGNTIVNRNFYYSSGYISMKDPARYGYFEVKCYIPTSILLNPCFWMFGGVWNPDITDYAEIDVFEKVIDTNNYLLMQNVYRDLNMTTVTCVNQKINFANNVTGHWDTYAVEWLPKEITFFINGNITSRVIYSDDHNLRPQDSSLPDNSVFTCANINNLVGQKIQLSLSLIDTITNPSVLNQKFLVEYVRSYKLREGFDNYAPTFFMISDSSGTIGNVYKVHKKIKLGGAGCIANINTTHNITLWASEEIVFDKGFEVSASTPFTARRIDVAPELFTP